ncbi:7055_t:CDS:2 [Ambispora leptoticha]|uniref:7055_t:CDS:1 n=1 Tax=Ambispora leptoticha TaxID=144679 RepID=A0A9N8W8C7_9GLOM|nr:7055_t:CDS:2 [Ambispora leptoticha]
MEGARVRRIALGLLFSICVITILLATLVESAWSLNEIDEINSNGAITTVHKPGYCVMRGECGPKTMFGKSLNCPFNEPAVKPDTELREKLVSICGAEFNSLTCCDADQLNTLYESTKQAETLISSCPACWKNFLKFFCTFTCSPNQSTFVNVTSTSISKTGQEIVTSVDFFVGENQGTGFYDSCKDIKFTATNGYVMDLIGGGAKNYHDFFVFLGQERPPLGSPFQINFPLIDPTGEMTPFDEPAKRCNDTDINYRCSCVDCQPVCPILDPTPSEKAACQIRSLSCLSFILILIYVSIIASIIGAYALKRHRDNRVDRTEYEPLALNGIENEQANRHNKSYWLNANLQDYFYQLGYICAKNPWKTIMICTLTVCVASLGWSQFAVETDPVRLWVAPNSESAQQKEFFDKNFGPFYRTQQIFITSSDPDNQSVVNYKTLKTLFIMEQEIRNLKSPKNNYKLQDLCFHPNGDACIVQSLAGYWNSDIDELDEDTWKEHLESCAAQPIFCLPDFQQPLKPDMILGGFEDENYFDAKAMVITLVLNNYIEGEKIAKAQEWEAALREYLDKIIKGDNKHIDVSQLKISFSTESSLEIELNKSTNTDIYTIVISYIVMFFYASIALGHLTALPRTIIDSKFSLGIAGILIVLASVSTSVGIFSFLGIKVTLIIAEVIPFLVLAVGVDNIFILNHEFERHPMKSMGGKSVEERVAKTLGKMGPSILLSALSETIAFGLGGIVTMPAVKNFALYAALAVWVDFLLQVTAFVAFLALDAKRQEEDRIDCFSCVKIKDAPKRIHREGVLQKWTRKYYAPVLLNKKVKIAVITIFLGVFMFSLGLVPKIELGLDQRIALPSDSYLVDYFNALDDYFRVGPPVYFVATDVNVTTRPGQQSLCGRFSTCSALSLANVLEQERKRPKVSYIGEPTAVWIDDFFHWLNPTLDQCCRIRENNGKTEICTPLDDPDECKVCFEDRDPKWNITMDGLPEDEEFISYLKLWLQASPDELCPLAGKAAYGDAIKIDQENATIIASHFRTFHTPLKSQRDYIAAYDSAHRISNMIQSRNNGIKVFPYSIFYIFFEQYAHIIKLTMETLILAFFSILIVTTTLLGSFWTGLLVMLHVVMIVVNLLGAMALWNVSLNAISLVNLVICVGIGVEFCVHIARAFVIGGSGDDRDARAERAIVDVGSSVFSGITLTKFFGILVLAFTRSKIFEVYYFRMYVAMVISGALHGLILLPVVLSLIGGEGIENDGENFDYNLFEDDDAGNRPNRRENNDSIHSTSTLMLLGPLRHKCADISIKFSLSIKSGGKKSTAATFLIRRSSSKSSQSPKKDGAKLSSVSSSNLIKSPLDDNTISLVNINNINTTKLENSTNVITPKTLLESPLKYRRNEPWSSFEEKILEILVEKHKKNWILISNMQLGRTPYDCKQKYKELQERRKQKKDAVKVARFGMFSSAESVTMEKKRMKDWSIEEIEQLDRLISNYGRRWKKIHKMFTNRSLQAIQTKARKSMRMFPSMLQDPSRHGKRWTEQEIEMLNNLVDQYGNNPEIIAENIPGRSVSAVAEFMKDNYYKLPVARVYRSLFQLTSRVPFTDEAIRDLFEIVKIIGFDAKKISRYFFWLSKERCQDILNLNVMKLFKRLDYSKFKQLAKIDEDWKVLIVRWFGPRFSNRQAINLLNKTETFLSWTTNEIELLEYLIGRYGTNWNKIEKHMPWRKFDDNAKFTSTKLLKDSPVTHEVITWTDSEKKNIQVFFENYGDNWNQILKGFWWRKLFDIKDFLLGPFDSLIHNDSKELLRLKARNSSWTEEEIEKLLSLTRLYGLDWEAISQSMRQRTPNQCQLFYLCRTLSIKNTKPVWTRAESFLLLRLVDEYGFNWGIIKEHFMRKTAENCALKFIQIHKRKFNKFIQAPTWPKGTIDKINEFVEREGDVDWQEIGKLIGKKDIVVHAYVETHLVKFPKIAYYLQKYPDIRSNINVTAKPKIPGLLLWQQRHTRKKWTPDESTYFEKLLDTYGKNWDLICRKITNRTYSSLCKKLIKDPRFHKYRGPLHRQSSWSNLEVLKLFALRRHNVDYRSIAMYLHNKRTPGACYKKLYKMQKKIEKGNKFDLI